MGRLLVPLGGGGGASSDECTAAANDILKGKTTINKDSDDEVVEGTLELTGNTSTGHVLNGETFYTTDAHAKQTGTMPNNTGRSTNGNVPGISSSYSQIPTREGTNLQMQTDTSGTSRISIAVPAGYYDGGGYINRPSSDFGTTSVDNVLSGSTFTSTAGIKKSGTMPNRGAWGSSVGVNGSVTIPAGYHNGSGKVTNSVSTMGGGTYTPSGSAQTIYCSGKYMTGNITFNAIPSGYVNVSSSGTFFNNGSYGELADLGAYTAEYSTRSGWSYYTYVSATDLINGNYSIPGNTGYSGVMSYGYLIFRRCVPTNRFKRFELRINYTTSSFTKYYFILLNSNVYQYSGDGVASSNNTTLNVPTNLDTSQKYCIALKVFGQGSRPGLEITSLIGYTN